MLLAFVYAHRLNPFWKTHGHIYQNICWEITIPHFSIALLAPLLGHFWDFYWIEFSEFKIWTLYVHWTHSDLSWENQPGGTLHAPSSLFSSVCQTGEQFTKALLCVITNRQAQLSLANKALYFQDFALWLIQLSPLL